MSVKEEIETWQKNCHFCHKTINYFKVPLKPVVGSFNKKVVYHQDCYEQLVLNFGTEEQRQDYFKMMKEGT